MGNMILSEVYVTAFVGAFGIYAVQMLAIPCRMTTDHFLGPAFDSIV
jgi:hypothetical protein